MVNANDLRALTEKNYNARLQETQEAIDALKKAKGIVEGGETKLETQEKAQDTQAAAAAQPAILWFIWNPSSFWKNIYYQ